MLKPHAQHESGALVSITILIEEAPRAPRAPTTRAPVGGCPSVTPEGGFAGPPVCRCPDLQPLSLQNREKPSVGGVLVPAAERTGRRG